MRYARLRYNARMRIKKGRWIQGRGFVRGMKASKRAKSEFIACWEMFDQASYSCVYHGPVYKIAQNTIVTRKGKVMMVV